MVVSLPRQRRDRRGGHDQRREDAQGRHTAGQRVLDATGNLKAVQKLLGHASIQTTGDIYADWDIDQLAATMADVLAADENDETADSQSFPLSPPQKPAICSGNGNQWRRWESNPRPQSRKVASTSVAGALISSPARLAGGVAGDQPP